MFRLVNPLVGIHKHIRYSSESNSVYVLGALYLDIICCYG